MQLTSPIIITARLMPGVKVGDSFISIGYSKRPTTEGRPYRFQCFIDTPEFEYDDHELQSGRFSSGGLQDGLVSLLSFLGAAAESYRYEMSGRKSDNSDLFPPHVMEWAYQHSSEIDMLRCEIEETPGLIEE